jgi:hypothetical protein
MVVSLEHAFRHIRCPESAELLVREEERKLLRMSLEILHCRVVVDKPHGNHVKGNHFHVLVIVSFPGHTLCVSHGPVARKSDEDLALAIRHAFHAARIQTRRLLSRIRKPPHAALHEAFGNGNSKSPLATETGDF